MPLAKFFKRERRKGIRVPFRVRISLSILTSNGTELVGAAVEGQIKNISIKGACILLPTMTLEGRHLFMDTEGVPEHKLLLTLPSAENDPGLSLPIEMKWFKDTEGGTYPFEAGVQFEDLSQDQKNQLKRLIKEK